MFPSNSEQNITGSYGAYPEVIAPVLICSSFLGSPKTNIQDLRFRKDRGWISRTGHIRPRHGYRAEALPIHIDHVVGGCSQKQVGWSNAVLHITGMKNAQTIGNRTVMQLPAKSVSRNVSCSGPTQTNQLVIGRINKSVIEPTGFGLNDVAPKSFFNGNSMRCHLSLRMHVDCIITHGRARVNPRKEYPMAKSTKPTKKTPTASKPAGSGPSHPPIGGVTPINKGR